MSVSVAHEFEEGLALAEHAARSHDNDVRPIIKIMTAIIKRLDAAAAFNLVSASSGNRDLWLPEALTLFNTPKLSLFQMQAMVRSFFSLASPPDPLSTALLARCNARLGRYGFSFPQWRYLAQAFNGVSLLERYGMQRLTRATDRRGPGQPHPGWDLFGTGFYWSKGAQYIEYRRAYLACSDSSKENAGTVIIRNNSCFFGRDRLPDPVYISWESTPPEDIQAITPDVFLSSGRFCRWQDIVNNTGSIALSEKIRRTQSLLNSMDDFDTNLSKWLFIPAEGLAHLLPFLNSKLEESSGAPFIAGINPAMPPWFPELAITVTPDLLKDLERYRDHGILKSPELKKFFNLVEKKRIKPVLLSGRNGDFPLRKLNSPCPTALPPIAPQL